jgi:hypothetical protein
VRRAFDPPPNQVAERIGLRNSTIPSANSDLRVRLKILIRDVTATDCNLPGDHCRIGSKDDAIAQCERFIERDLPVNSTFRAPLEQLRIITLKPCGDQPVRSSGPNYSYGREGWRDTKSAFVLFNRNADFSAVLQKIAAATLKHPHCKGEVAKPDEMTLRYVLGSQATRTGR